MTRLVRFALFGSAIFSGMPVIAADPLPKGAVARIGTPRMRDNAGWGNAVLSPDGKHLITASPKGLIKIDASTGEPAGPLSEKSGGFDRRIELSADARRVLSLSYSSGVVWESSSGKSLAEVKRAIPFGESSGSLSADGQVFALGGTSDIKSKDKPITALVWDVEKNAKLAEVEVLQNQSASVSLSPDGKLLATWGTHTVKNPPKEGIDPATDPTQIMQFWDVTSGKELSKTSTHGYNPRVTFAPDGHTAAVYYGGGSIRLVDPKTGADRRRLFGRVDQGWRIAFSPDGKTLASAGIDGTVQLWNLADGARIGFVECPAGHLALGVRGIGFTSPDRAVAWTAVGSTAIVWEVPSGKLLSPLSGHVAAVRSIAFGSEGKEVLTGGDDGLLFRWDLAGKELGEVKLRSSGGFTSTTRYPMYQVVLTPDGKSAMASASSSGIFEIATGRQIASTYFGQSDSRGLLCTDGRTLVVVPFVPYPPKPQPKSLAVVVWDVSNGSKLCAFEIPVGEITHAAVSPDRSKLVALVTTRTADKSEFHAIAWELATGKKLGAYTEAGGYNPVHLAMAPDNIHALVATPAGKFVAVNLLDGRAAKEIDAGKRVPTAPPAFAPGGKSFTYAIPVGFGAEQSSEIRIHDWESGKLVGGFRGHSGAVTCLAYSPDGKTLATGSYDTTVLLWNVAAAAPPE